MYALNYMINIYCLRMSDISGAAQTQSQRLLIFHASTSTSRFQSWPKNHLCHKRRDY
jgi:hypothetical protein